MQIYTFFEIYHKEHIEIFCANKQFELGNVSPDCNTLLEVDIVLVVNNHGPSKGAGDDGER